MADFNTQGGYFAPKDYTRVNEGGSHEENPYGGVQLGVDPEGNPNLLEEGEPVYKDYVYSDNIIAEAEFLEQNNLPARYAGKLYSKIADDLFEEAEERPMDPISSNGLEAMLGRLAEAQESQKQRDQQKALEEELAQLSPEELDALEAMLTEQEQPEMVEPAPMQMPGGMPMMACGGHIRRFDQGGSLDGDDDIDKILAAAKERRGEAIERNKEYEKAQSELRKAENRYAWRKFVNNVIYFGDNGYEKSRAALGTMLQDYESGKDVGGAYNQEKAIRHQADYVNELKEKKDKRDAKLQKALDARDAAAKKVAALRPTGAGFLDTGDLMFDDEPTVLGAPRDTTKKIGTGWGMNDIDWSDYDENAFACGGKVNRFDNGGWPAFMTRVNGYTPSRTAGRISGTYAPDANFQFGKYNDILGLEASPEYRGFTDYVLANPTNADVLNYLRALDAGTNQKNNVPLLFGSDNQLVPGWDKLYRDRRNDHVAGIYHLNPDDIGFLTAPAVSAAPAQNPQPASVAYARMQTADDSYWRPGGMWTGLRGVDTEVPAVSAEITLPRGIMYDWVRDNRTGTAYRPKPQEEPTLFPGYDLTWNGIVAKNGTTPAPVAATGEAETGVRQMPGYRPLPTFPRYAGAFGAGLLGLYDAFIPADKYVQPHLNSKTPEGRIHMQNEVYNPVDQNMVVNSILAQGNATTRALRNSGLGPSTGAAILAGDNNTSGNIGTGFIQAWDANNQRRNQVIAANNAVEAQRAAFDYDVDRQRKAILNEAAYRNAYNNLMLQRLNYGAEGEKYQAIGNQISIGLKALSDTGTQNFNMNQVNTNPAYLGYRVAPDGTMRYMPWYAGCGGFIKKYKK